MSMFELWIFDDQVEIRCKADGSCVYKFPDSDYGIARKWCNALNSEHLVRRTMRERGMSDPMARLVICEEIGHLIRVDVVDGHVNCARCQTVLEEAEYGQEE